MAGDFAHDTTRSPGPTRVRVMAGVTTCLALATSVFLFQERADIGFPDGYVSAYDQIRSTLLAVAFAASLLAAIPFAYVGWSGSGRLGKKLGVAAVTYGVFVALTFAVDHALSQRSGGGG